ncbi:hypothetical protein V5T82_15105 [Magnetovibrio sp. PR-2]|uniref:hypothetical protein n=1 Tax=Magnetovibrio sp. PR-2 TaxID=3120356 RepID=UPI002FCDFFAC
MTNYPVPTDEQMAFIQEQFVHLSATQELLDEASAEGAKRTIPSQLYAYATGVILYPDADLEMALRKSPGMRATYRRILDGTSLYDFGTAMAASDGDLLPRAGKGCSIRFERSQAEAGQYYVIIELTDDTGHIPTKLVICDDENNCQQFDVPQARRGIIQLRVHDDHEILALLRNAKTEVLLR